MKIRILSIIVSAAIASTFCVAQTTQNTLLDLQTSPTIFFDPTAEKEARFSTEGGGGKGLFKCLLSKAPRLVLEEIWADQP